MVKFTLAVNQLAILWDLKKLYKHWTKDVTEKLKEGFEYKYD